MSVPRAGPGGAVIGVVLPADWWVVPLADEAARGRAIAALVDHGLGPEPATRLLRRELRVGVGAAARRAASSGGWVMALMLTRAGEHALPATMTGYRSPGSFADDSGVAAASAAIEPAALARGGRLDVGTGPFGVVLRSVRRLTGVWHGVVDLPLVACDYWTDPADGHGLVHLAFTTPLVELEEACVALFDAVTGTLHAVPDPDGAPAAPGADALPARDVRNTS